MAEKNEKKNEAEVMEPAAAETVNPVNISTVDDADFNFLEDEEGGERRVESSVDLRDTSLFLIRKNPHQDKEEKDLFYYDYETGVKVPINGVKTVLKVFLEPVPGGKISARLLNSIIGAEVGAKTYPLKVERTVLTYNNKKEVSYKYIVEGKTDSGLVLSVEMRPNKKSGGKMSENILSVLRDRGEIF